ncbi:MFS transporter [Nocardiopsis alba]
MNGEGLLRNRRFRTFFLGSLVSLAGRSMTPVALAFGVLQKDGGEQALGYVLAAQMVPLILLTLVGGAVADRFDRGRVLRWSNATTGLTQLCTAALLFGPAPIYAIVPVAVLNGAAGAFTTPALRGVLPEIVPADQLTRANSLLKTARNSAQIGGPVVAGLLVAASSGSLALAIDGAAFLFAAWLMGRLDLGPPRPAEERSSLLRDLKEGWSYFSGTTWIWTVTTTFLLMNVLQTGIWQILGPILASDSIGASGWGIVLGAKAVGLVVASVYLIRFAGRRRVASALAVMSLAGLPLFALGITQELPLLAGAAFVGGWPPPTAESCGTRRYRPTCPTRCSLVWRPTTTWAHISGSRWPR